MRLQQLDLKVEVFCIREVEIPKQKKRFEGDRKRLEQELQDRENKCKDLKLEQKSCEGEVEQMQTQIEKYDQQLYAVKKNEEYQALLHEIDALKKHIGLKEERILNIMEELDEAEARLEEDRKRIKSEKNELDRQCAAIDEELALAVNERQTLESQREPIAHQIDPALLNLYHRIRTSKKQGAVVVPLREDACTGCNMAVTAQMANEILAGEKTHKCRHCGRVLYHPENIPDADKVGVEEG